MVRFQRSRLIEANKLSFPYSLLLTNTEDRTGGQNFLSHHLPFHHLPNPYLPTPLRKTVDTQSFKHMAIRAWVARHHPVASDGRF